MSFGKHIDAWSVFVTHIVLVLSPCIVSSFAASNEPSHFASNHEDHVGGRVHTRRAPETRNALSAIDRLSL